MTVWRSSIALLSGLVWLFGGVSFASSVNCEDLREWATSTVIVTLVEAVPSGSFSAPIGRPVTAVPAFCRVAGAIRPTRGSEIRFEVWMPVSGWSGRLVGVGNFGFGGEIVYDAMAVALRRHDATVSTDTGHESAEWGSAQWALGHRERIVDFGYRAVHEATVAAKTIVRRYYGRGAAHSYFQACSNGGRQALMEAQRYPGDYDGIIAGSPAYDFTRLLSHGAWVTNAVLAGSLPANKLPAIQAAALEACDGRDGIQDGVVESPLRCQPNLSALLCRGAESDDCLTSTQLTTAQTLYAGSQTLDGRLFSHGSLPGGESGVGGWEHWYTGPGIRQEMVYQSGKGWSQWVTQPVVAQSLAYIFATQFFRYMVFGDPKWDVTTFNLDRDSNTAAARLGGVLNATATDLTAFQGRGGKLILYHGWCDAGVPPEGTVDYYDAIVSKSGAPKARRFVRLFMVPGMQHCTGGTGPTEFGQTGPGTVDPEHDIFSALVRWVEQDAPPEYLVAVKRNPAENQGRNVSVTRLLCAYPAVARYKGTGSTNDARNFTCFPPPR